MKLGSGNVVKADRASILPVASFVAALLATMLLGALAALSMFGIPTTLHEARADRSHVPELSFYVGVLFSAPIWLAGIWTTAFAFATGARSLVRYLGLGICAAAAAVFALMFSLRPDL
ncbi:hypothetical protein [Methylobacterium oxalidis]|nr:hypothetical protein [Methylobacterium oxalidis]GJE31882.1 hypothetical protein LDDCCGHA_2064 [Methylobacterium oxalidis]